MKRSGLFGIQRVQVLLLFVFTFSFMTAKPSFMLAQELPKSWMPKWKVGDWWRVKFVSFNDKLGTRFYKYEIIGSEYIKGGKGFVIKIIDEVSQDSEIFIVDKHLTVRKRFRSEKCRGQKGCGGDEGFTFGFEGAAPYPLAGFMSHFELPAFPLIVGKTKYVRGGKMGGDYYVQQVRRVTGQELVDKGFKTKGLFKQNQNYYEVIITDATGVGVSGQIWSPDAPYWVTTGNFNWLVDHSWMKK